MRLTNYSDYALRTLMYLAVMPSLHELATINDIANSYGISKSHLTKIIHQLAKLGFIDSVRGKHGGIRLAKLPECINLGEVIRHTEPDFDIVPCFARAATDATSASPNTPQQTESRCVITPQCQLKNIIADATAAFLQVLDGYTLADIIQENHELWYLLNKQW